MQTHHCICMIYTEFMGSLPKGAAGCWGGYTSKESEKPTKRRRESPSLSQHCMLKQGLAQVNPKHWD